jgi:hypothetical protein
MGRFARMIEASGLAPTPRFEQIELRGGVFANAIALPSLRRSAVVLTETLLTRFDHDEIAAVSAHEIAHLEHYNRRKLRRLSPLNQSLIVLGAAMTPVASLFFPADAIAVPYLWASAVLVMVLSRARARQRHETESDLRAVALTGDPESVIRALIKLHAMARIPRRWNALMEARATHPSLARRIRAIRAMAGGAPALGEAAKFASADGASSVTFLDDHLLWNQGGSAAQTLPYGELDELRVDARGTGPIHLVAVHRAGLRWALALPLEAVDRAQAVLDIVDARVSGPVARPAVSHPLARVLTGLTAGAAIAAGQYALGFAALLPVARTAPPMLAASGAAATVMAALILRDHGPHQSITWLAVALLLDGLTMLCIALRSRQGNVPAWLRPLIAAVGICAGLTWAAVVAAGPDLVSLHQAARGWPATVIWPLALTTGLAFSSSRVVRRLSLPIALSGLLAGVAGSTTFLEHFSRDSFVAPAERLTAAPITAAPFAEFSVPFVVSGIQVSRDGRHIALRSEDQDEHATFHVGLLNGPLAAFEGEEGVFIDDRRLLLLDQQPRGAFLREIRIDRSCQVLWQQVVPGLLSARLSFDPASNRWRLLGWNNTGDVVRAAGTVGGTAIETEQWSAFRGREQQADTVPTSGRDAIVLEIIVQPRFRRLGRWRPLTTLLAPFTRLETRLWAVGSGGAREIAASPLPVTCDGALRSDELPVCAAFDGTRTRLFAVDADTRRLTPAGWLPGRFILGSHAGNGWLTGWLMGQAAVRLDTREIVRPPALDEALSVTAVGATDDVFATAAGRQTASHIRLYARR